MVDIIKEYFGFSTKEAKIYIKNTDKKILEEIKKGFIKNSQQAFLED